MFSFLFFSLETWTLLISFIGIFVLYGYWSFGVFDKLGIPGPKPLMYFGTIGRYNKVYYLDDMECAKKYGRVWGMYELRKSVLAVMDPDMLKTILVKECFTYFTNRRSLILNGDLYDALVFSEDDHWRRIRHLVSPSFTSGRIKEMFSLMKHNSHKLTENLRSKAHGGEVIAIKDFFAGYTIDVLGSCAFSVDLDTINKPANPLITHAEKMFKISVPLFLLQGCFPFLSPVLDLLGFSFFPKSTTDYFKTLVEKIRAERSDSSKQNFSDFLHSFTSSQTGSKENPNKGLTDHEVISTVTMFVFAGFETSANTLVFLAYSLARNPEVMKHLQREIDLTFPNKAPVQYEALMQMDYLSSVVDECLRLYPTIPRLDRVAKETVKINGITIPKGMAIMVPVYALHYDPELWPQPEEFKPERFSKENKQKINPYTYLPFGMGPRNCLGMRFALAMIKLALVEVLQNYSFSVCEETEIPLKMDPSGLVGPLKPIKLKLMMRSMDDAEVGKGN
ncbi:cytochrome P450 3A56-like [Menidia menidia]